MLFHFFQDKDLIGFIQRQNDLETYQISRGNECTNYVSDLTSARNTNKRLTIMKTQIIAVAVLIIELFTCIDLQI